MFGASIKIRWEEQLVYPVFVDFKTWLRIVNNSLEESTLDHIYVRDPTMVVEIKSLKAVFGNHDYKR